MQSSKTKYITRPMLAQFFLCLLPIILDASSIGDAIGLYLYISMGTLFFGVLLLYVRLERCWESVLFGAFYSFTVASLVMLVLLNIKVLATGNVAESAVLLLPYAGAYLVLLPVGAVAGLVFCLVRKSIEQR